jgi:hypothetical protein
VIEDRPSSSPTIGAKAITAMVSRIDADAVPQIDGIACVIWIKDGPCRRPVAAEKCLPHEPMVRPTLRWRE